MAEFVHRCKVWKSVPRYPGCAMSRPMHTSHPIRCMIESAVTKPELAVRRLAHGMGYRYRLNRRDLPGTPDLVFPSRRKVIFVHGCFWHQHDCRLGQKQPSTNRDYWLPKLARNVERDAENQTRLAQLGWEALIVWECEIKNTSVLRDRIRAFLA